MPLVSKSLDAASSTGPGATVMFDTPKSVISMQISYTGSPSEVRVGFEGTLDGIQFGELVNMFATDDAQIGSFLTVTDHAIIGVRANLTNLVGGSSPTVTAVVAAIE